jgi:hypothetical protein
MQEVTNYNQVQLFSLFYLLHDHFLVIEVEIDPITLIVVSIVLMYLGYLSFFYLLIFLLSYFLYFIMFNS